MASELSVKGKKEFEELTRALEWSNEFAIYFAVVNPPLIRKQMADELKGSLEKEEIKVHSLELNSSYFDLLSIIPENVPSYCLRGAETEIRSVLFIFGAEEAIAADVDTRRLFFDCLNWQRDKLRETIACPLVIWLPEFALSILALETPDFWAWRSGVYYLEPEPVWILKDTEELFEGGPGEYDILTYQERIRRLQQFKALLEDYERQPFGTELQSELLEIRFDLLQEVGEVSFSLANYEEAKQYFLQGLEIAKGLKNKELLATIFKNLILVSIAHVDYTSAEEYTGEVLEIAQEIGDKRGMGRFFGVLGLVAREQKSYNKAEEFFKKGLKIGKELEDKELTALALGLLGSLARIQKKYTEAKSFFKQSLKINEEIGEKKGLIEILFELSELAKNQGKIDEAVRRVEEAQEISNEIKDVVRISKSSEKLGSLAEAQGDYQHAQKYYEESLEIYEQLGNKLNICSIYVDLGRVAQDLGNYKKAKRCYKDSLKISEEMGSKRLIALNQVFLGELYLKTEDFNKAERHFLDALGIFESLDDSEMIKIVRQNLEQVRQGKLQR